MFPVLFEFSGFILYTQTVCLAFAFIAGLLTAIRTGRQFALPRYELTNLIFYGFISSIIGARLMFILLTWDLAAFSLKEFCTFGVRGGGFAFHGGLLFGALAVYYGARYYKLSLWRLGDTLAPGLAVAMFLMRLGCLCNGCDYGAATTLPWGIMLHGAARHPIQLYEGVGNLLLLPVILVLNHRPLRPGRVLLIYLMFSGLLRFGVDFWREEYILLWRLGGIFTIPQLIAAGIALIAGWMLLSHRSNTPPTHPDNRS